MQGVIEDEYDGMAVTRFCFDPWLAPNRTYYEYYNPLLGEWARAHFKEHNPDVIHFTHGAHLTSAVIEAACEVDIITMLTLTDFWFICPRIQLTREDGALCPGPERTADCLACCSPDFVALYQKYAGLFQPLNERPPSGAFFKKAVVAYDRNPLCAALVAALNRKAFLQEILDRVGTIIAPSRFLLNMYRRHGVREEKLKHVPFGLDVAHLQENEKTPSSRMRIGFVGTLAPHKGCHVLVEAFTLLKSDRLELSLYGSTEEFPDYAAKVKALASGDKRIHFKGTFPPENIGNVFSDIDVLVVPSIWYENTPLIVYAAFAAKTPIIASDMGGLSEVIEPGGNGMLFQKEDVEGLRECLEKILLEPNLLKKLKAGIRPVKKMEAHAEEILGEYEKLLSGRNDADGGH
jgi:glycosyltransferase involved in cell wall biosynthesis